MGTTIQHKNDPWKWVVFLLLAATFVVILLGCNVSKNSEKGVTKYRAGYHALSDSVPENCDADSSNKFKALGFLPAIPPCGELTDRQYRQQFRQYKKELRKNRTDKRTKAKRDFVLAKKQIKQQGKTDRVEVKQNSKTERVKAKQDGRTDRVEVRRKNGLFSRLFTPVILFSIIIITFVVLVFIYKRKIFNNEATRISDAGLRDQRKVEDVRSEHDY